MDQFSGGRSLCQGFGYFVSLKIALEPEKVKV
jgi:hypothetical protein